MAMRRSGRMEEETEGMAVTVTVTGTGTSGKRQAASGGCYGNGAARPCPAFRHNPALLHHKESSP
jgi:hypothetical protein